MINGYEWTENRAQELRGDPALLRLPTPIDGSPWQPLRAWDDLKKPRPDGGSWTVGVLVGSAADNYAASKAGGTSGRSSSTAPPTP